MRQMSPAKPPPPLNVKLMFKGPPVISLFSFLHTGAAFMVIVQFRGRLVRQHRACVVGSLGLGITCLISLYYVYKAS